MQTYVVRIIDPPITVGPFKDAHAANEYACRCWRHREWLVQPLVGITYGVDTNTAVR
jgi:hypothetical protein